MYRATVSKILMTAYDYTTGAFKTGDAANITVYVSKDGGAATVLADTSATELDATNAKGVYWFDVTATETDAQDLLFTGKSATANIQIVPKQISTTWGNNFAMLGAYPHLGIVDSGTAQSATTTTLVIRSAASFGDSAAVGVTAMVYGTGQGYWQQRAATQNVGSTDTFTVDAWDVTPTGTITYILFGTAPFSASSFRTAFGLASPNLDSQLAPLSQVSSSGKLKVDNEEVRGTPLIGTGVAGDNWRPTGSSPS
jgi:hypothetical protein